MRPDCAMSPRRNRSVPTLLSASSVIQSPVRRSDSHASHCRSPPSLAHLLHSEKATSKSSARIVSSLSVKSPRNRTSTSATLFGQTASIFEHISVTTSALSEIQKFNKPFPVPRKGTSPRLHRLLNWKSVDFRSSRFTLADREDKMVNEHEGILEADYKSKMKFLLRFLDLLRRPRCEQKTKNSMCNREKSIGKLIFHNEGIIEPWLMVHCDIFSNFAKFADINNFGPRAFTRYLTECVLTNVTCF